MNILLIFFAIPLAVIVLSAILETFIHCPFKIAGIFFSIFIVVAFALGGSATQIVASIIYTLIAFITAVVVRLIINRMCNRCDNENRCRFCRNEYSSCNSASLDSISNQCNNRFPYYDDLNTLNRLNNFNNIANLNNRELNNNILNGDAIEQVTRGSSNAINTNNFCRRGR